jgi:hypothetical protein
VSDRPPQARPPLGEVRAEIVRRAIMSWMKDRERIDAALARLKAEQERLAVSEEVWAEVLNSPEPD